MKIKKIMLITLMLLAVLAIGAVSAADDAASDNLTITDESVSDNLAVDDSVADDNLIGANYDSDYHGIEVVDYKELYITDETEEIAHIDLPSGTKGSFRIYNGNEIVARQDFNPEDDTGDPDKDYGWNDDGDDRCGYITMNMFNLTNVRDGDVLTFKFLELKNSEYTEVDMFTLQYNVTLIDSTMQLTEVGGSGFGEDNYDITVGNIYFNDAAENFTVVNATQNAGFLIITAGNIDEPIYIADLSKAAYKEGVDDTGDTIYIFGFSLNDINNYISKGEFDVSSLKEWVESGDIDTDDDFNFEIYESVSAYEEGDDSLFEKTMTVTDITEEGILFVDEDAVYVEYENKIIEMKYGWNETELYTFTVRTDIKGRIVIYINNTETPAFNKSLKELQGPDYDPDMEENDYVVTVGDLNLTEAGTYEIHEYLVGENGDTLHKYDLDEPLTVKLIESQETTVDNVTIHINPDTIIIPSNDAIITIINASDNLADVLLVYVDDNEEPLQFVIGDCNIDGENYFINASQLNLGVGKHNIKVSYKDNNKNGTVNLQSNLIIEIMYDGPAVYTDMGVAFVYISFENEIEQDKFEGKINLTIKDGEEIKESYELDASQLIPFDDDYVITTNQIKINLTGNYTVLVKYFDGSEAETQAEDNVTFKAFDPKDYGAAIKDTIKDKGDYLITFTDIPLENEIIKVDIDGDSIFRFYDYDDIGFNGTVYYLKYSQFVKYFQFDDGPHSINVSLESDKEDILLANGTVIIDLVENIDPSLTISIANITEGAAANIVISTNETFTGDVLVKIGNNNYTISVTNGTGSLPVAGLAVGTHNATAFFKANAIFNESTKNTTFTVNPKVATSVTAPAITTTYATSKNIVVTLKDANGNTLAGKEVVITFNGASKNVKTNDKGQAVLAIGTKLAPKKYDATFKFAGDSAYAESSGAVKVIVNKAKPKITAKKKTFKAKKKTKKYTIVLKTDKKKPLKKVKVTIKIGKKKFKAKTNNKGKATFKLKKLTKRGKYKATVKFSGNKYYKAVSKKVKITIKK